jgi:hypothetical protein
MMHLSSRAAQHVQSDPQSKFVLTIVGTKVSRLMRSRDPQFVPETGA